MLSGFFPITPGGVGQTQALDIATLHGHAAADDIAALSITRDCASRGRRSVEEAQRVVAVPRES